MSIVYPTSLDSFTHVTDSVDYPQAIHINDPYDAIEALETKVGVDNSTVATSHDYKIAHLIQPYMTRGYLERSQFTYNGGTIAYTIKVGAGAYVVKDKYAYWDSELTTNAISTPTADTWYYLYLDYSAITSGTLITASELIWSSTAPAFNNTYRQWMNGDDRCIFAVRTNSTPDNILDFIHDGGDLVYWATYIAILTNVTLTSTPTAYSLSTGMPENISTLALVKFRHNLGTVASDLFWRVAYNTNSEHLVISTTASNQSANSTCPVSTASDRAIDLWQTSGADAQTSIAVEGFYLPRNI